MQSRSAAPRSARSGREHDAHAGGERRDRRRAERQSTPARTAQHFVAAWLFQVSVLPFPFLRPQIAIARRARYVAVRTVRTHDHCRFRPPDSATVLTARCTALTRTLHVHALPPLWTPRPARPRRQPDAAAAAPVGPVTRHGCSTNAPGAQRRIALALWRRLYTAEEHEPWRRKTRKPAIPSEGHAHSTLPCHNVLYASRCRPPDVLRWNTLVWKRRSLWHAPLEVSLSPTLGFAV